jgi:hypothetical protein
MTDLHNCVNCLINTSMAETSNPRFRSQASEFNQLARALSLSLTHTQPNKIIPTETQPSRQWKENKTGQSTKSWRRQEGRSREKPWIHLGSNPNGGGGGGGSGVLCPEREILFCWRRRLGGERGRVFMVSQADGVWLYICERARRCATSDDGGVLPGSAFPFPRTHAPGSARLAACGSQPSLA